MNKVTMERVAEKVLRAISDEKLSIKEAGEILGVKSNYLSMIKKDTYYDKVPKKDWDSLHAWVNSGADKIMGGHKRTQDHDIMCPNLEEKQPEEETKKDLFSDLAKAKYIPPEKKGSTKPLPPVVQEAIARKLQKDLANEPIVRDVILNVKINFNLSIE